MDSRLKIGISLLAGIGFLLSALAVHAVLLEFVVWNVVLGAVGLGLLLVGVVSMRKEIGPLFQRRRAGIVLSTIGLLGIYICVGYFSLVYPWRYDMTAASLYSLSSQTKAMLQRLEQPVHIIFFHSHQILLLLEIEIKDICTIQN